MAWRGKNVSRSLVRRVVPACCCVLLLVLLPPAVAIRLQVRVRCVSNIEREYSADTLKKNTLLLEWMKKQHQYSLDFKGRTKAILLFQEVDRVDVCFFAMYVCVYVRGRNRLFGLGKHEHVGLLSTPRQCSCLPKQTD